MMRVAHVGNYEPEHANGVSQAVARYVKYLSWEGFEVELWHFNSKVDAVRERWADGVTVFDLPCYRWRLQNTVHVPRETRRFLEQRSQVVDLVHLHAAFR